MSDSDEKNININSTSENLQVEDDLPDPDVKIILLGMYNYFFLSI
jgi:hypothetical protein